MSRAIFVLLLITPFALSSDIPEYQCKTQNKHLQKCYLEGLEVNETNPSFTIKPLNNSKIEEIVLVGSKISVWDNNVCNGQNSESLEIHRARNSSIKKIGPNTFKNCSKLRELDFSDNEIESIESGTFSSLLNLESLNLGTNKIAHFQLAALEGLENLKVLHLDANLLFDFDERGFKINYPGVKIYVQNNKFRCGRALRIQKVFPNEDAQGKNVSCLSNDMWMEQLYRTVPNKKALAQYREELLNETEYNPIYVDLFSDIEVENKTKEVVGDTSTHTHFLGWISLIVLVAVITVTGFYVTTYVSKRKNFFL